MWSVGERVWVKDPETGLETAAVVHEVLNRKVRWVKWPNGTQVKIDTDAESQATIRIRTDGSEPIQVQWAHDREKGHLAAAASAARAEAKALECSIADCTLLGTKVLLVRHHHHKVSSARRWPRSTTRICRSVLIPSSCDPGAPVGPTYLL